MQMSLKNRIKIAFPEMTFHSAGFSIIIQDQQRNPMTPGGKENHLPCSESSPRQVHSQLYPEMMRAERDWLIRSHASGVWPPPPHRAPHTFLSTTGKHPQ